MSSTTLKITCYLHERPVRPGMENLPEEVTQQQQQRRIQHLETEIQTFKENIEKVKRGEL